MCLGQGLPSIKHHLSGSYYDGLSIRAANSGCEHTPNTELSPRVRQFSLNADKNPEKNQRGGFCYSHPSQTQELRPSR